MEHSVLNGTTPGKYFPNIGLGKEGFLNSVQETGVLSGKETDCKNAATEHSASKSHTY